MARSVDTIKTLLYKLSNDDHVNYALLNLTRNESRLLFLYDRNIKITPPYISVINNYVRIHQLNELIKNSIKRIVDEQSYLEHLIRKVPFSDVQQVILDEHIQHEKHYLTRCIHLLNTMVVHTKTIHRTTQEQH